MHPNCSSISNNLAIANYFRHKESRRTDTPDRCHYEPREGFAGRKVAEYRPRIAANRTTATTKNGLRFFCESIGENATTDTAILPQ